MLNRLAQEAVRLTCIWEVHNSNLSVCLFVCLFMVYLTMVPVARICVASNDGMISEC
jgi:hypothetical protein